ncbi:MAG: hypothetical protein ACRC42_03765 [Mycoplasma sp.]
MKGRNKPTIVTKIADTINGFDQSIGGIGSFCIVAIALKIKSFI